MGTQAAFYGQSREEKGSSAGSDERVSRWIESRETSWPERLVRTNVFFLSPDGLGVGLGWWLRVAGDEEKTRREGEKALSPRSKWPLPSVLWSSKYGVYTTTTVKEQIVFLWDACKLL